MTVIKKCLVCGKEFAARVPKRGRSAVYCSNSCRLKASRLGIKAPKKRICPICGKVFYQVIKTTPRKYCSRKCKLIVKSRGNKIRAAMYAKRLRNARPKDPVSYKEIRRANLRRGLQDGWRGQPCMGGGSKALSLVPSA